MSHVFPDLTKKQAFYLTTLIPLQSPKIISALRKELNKVHDSKFNFNDFMSRLFWSKDILKRTGYYHLKTALEKNKNI
jgi:hypothetical protein